MEPIELVDRWIEAVKGEECWGVAAGGCVGSAFTMEFGKKIRRPRPLMNEKLSNTQRLFKGAFSIYVQDSPWKLGTDNDEHARITTTSNEDHSPDGPIVRGLQSVVGNSIRVVLYDPKTHDLDLYFRKGDVRLKIFGDVSPEATGYSLFLPTHVILIARDALQIERC